MPDRKAQRDQADEWATTPIGQPRRGLEDFGFSGAEVRAIHREAGNDAGTAVYQGREFRAPDSPGEKRAVKSMLKPRKRGY